MVMPGFADTVDVMGYLIERCSECNQRSVFTVFEARRRLTIAMIPTPVDLNRQHVMECRTCGTRFHVPKTWEPLAGSDRLMSQGQLSAYIRNMNAGAGGAHGMPPRPQQTVGNGRRTAYQILQVDPSADQDVIEAAFKRLALKAHPDRNEGPQAAVRMRELTAARDLLSTPERRFAYDRSIGINRPPADYQPVATPARREPSPAAPRPPASPAARREPERPRSSGAAAAASDGKPLALRPPGPRPQGIRADEV